MLALVIVAIEIIDGHMLSRRLQVCRLEMGRAA
jgi:hypothetical protein